MIEPSELRVGNLVRWNPKLSHPETTTPAMEVEVSSILEDRLEYVFPNIEHRLEPFEDDVVQSGSRFKLFEELEPVPLTPEVLERLEFEAAGSKW